MECFVLLGKWTVFLYTIEGDNMNQYKGFYKKSRQERIDILHDIEGLDKAYLEPLQNEIMENMIENAITTFELPMGVAPGFLINNKEINIPMATEESSVIAAASNAAKIIKNNGGFTTKIQTRLMRGEIVFANPKDNENIKSLIMMNKEKLITIANEAHPSIVKRGGGVKTFGIREVKNEKASFLILDVFMDTQEAMGANMMNTILEALSHHLETLTHEKTLISILSNLTTECIVEATCSIDPSSLRFELETAQNIELASELAKVDVYRCATHNKGIMNGIDAVVIASGNDSRAVNAGVYTFASLSGGMQPLATWTLINNKLIGKIILPLAVGSVGGAISIHPKAKLSKSIMKYENVQELMSNIACVGLAQNFAALYALTTEGIQKGHMALHATNIAISAGCPEHLLEEVSEKLRKEALVNIETAKKIIDDLK